MASESDQIQDDRRGLVWQLAGHGYVGALCHGSPQDLVFESLADWVQFKGLEIAGLFIEDHRGGFDAARSDCLRNLSESLGAPVVVLTHSPLMRGAVAAARWLGQEVYAFRLEGLEEAFEELAVPEAARPGIRAALHALRLARKLGGGHRRRSSDSHPQSI